MIHRFDDVVIDDELNEVHVGSRVCSPEPQVLRVLTHLITNHDRVVGKEELLDEVWGTRFVGDAAITSRIKSARQAIGDSGRDQRYIKTIHGRGYRFVGPIAGRAPATPVTTGASIGAAMAGRPDAGWPLVGREIDLAHVDVVMASGRSVLLTGPAGVGKTRLARAVLEHHEAEGAPTARINGHSEGSGIPLAAMAHLLPSDLADAGDMSGDFARTILLERARASVTASAGDRPLVVMIDDVDRVDTLSLALLGSLIGSGTVTAIMTQRDAGDSPVFAQLIAGGRIVRSEVGPVGADRLAELLTTVLDGPVRPTTTEMLIGAADGNPGMLRQLIESSRSAHTLRRSDGVWELTGPITPGVDLAAVMRKRLADLTSTQRDAAEALALAGELALDFAAELIDEETLDALELAGLLSVRDVGGVARVRLVHPLFEEVLRADLSALRERTLRRTMADTMSSWLGSTKTAQPVDRLQLVRFQLESGRDVDDVLAIESARLALIEGEVGLAERLLDRIEPTDPTTHARLGLLRAKSLFLTGRFDDADAVLRTIDEDALDPREGALVVRRMATSIFYSNWRMLDAVEYLWDQLDRFDGENRRRLEAFWVMLAGVDGRRTREAVEIGNRLTTDVDPFTRAEALAGLAMAHCMRGEYATGLARAEEFGRLANQLPASSSWVGRDYVWTAELLTLTELGRGHDAWRIAQREMASVAVPTVGFLAISAARVALRTGHPEQALIWVTPLIQLCETIGHVTSARPLQATSARAALATGDVARAELEAAIMEATIVDDPHSMIALDLLESVLRIEADVGDRGAAVERMIDAAAEARSHNQTMMEGSLLAAAVEFGGAGRALARLEGLAQTVDEGLIDLKVAHARAAAAADPRALAEVAERYERAGFAAIATAVMATPI